MRNQGKSRFKAVRIQLVPILLVLFSGLVNTDLAGAATTNPKKTYWHSVGSDRFRAYDVGGEKEKKEIKLCAPGFLLVKGPCKTYGVPWHAMALREEDTGLPGPLPYKNAWPGLWKHIKILIRAANRSYAQHVDWPVTFIFKNQASLGYVKDRLRDTELDTGGSIMWMTLADNMTAGGGGNLWDKDGGLKEFACSNDILGIGPKATNHIRFYADERGAGEDNSDDMMVNRYWGYYVLATTHIDYLECPPWGDNRKFGWSEKAAERILDDVGDVFGKWQIECDQGYGERDFCYDKYNMHNKEPKRYQGGGSHIWENDGMATVVRIGDSNPVASSASQEEGEEEEGEEEELPPAVDSDVDGDEHADLVALHSGGSVTTVDGVTAERAFSFAGTMDSALFDGKGHHVVDVADVTGDLQSDLVTLAHTGTAYTYPGREDHTFGPPVPSFAGTMPAALFHPGVTGHQPIGVADVTGDEHADLVSYHTGEKRIYTYPGKEDGSFGAAIGYSANGIDSALFDRSGEYFVDVDDVNGDNYADVVSVPTSGAVKIYKGAANGSFTTVTTGVTVDPVMDNGTGAEPLGVADVNGDGRADLAVLNSSKEVIVAPGITSSPYLSSSTVKALTEVDSNLVDKEGEELIGLLDRNADGQADLVKVTAAGVVQHAMGQTNHTFSTFSQWQYGLGSRRFETTPGHEMAIEKQIVRKAGCSASGCIWPPPVTESDVDGDRRADLVSVESVGTAETFRALGAKRRAPSSFGGTLDPALFDGKGHHVVDVADVTGDRQSDLVTLKEGTAYTHAGRGDGSFAPAVSSLGGALTPGPHDATGYEPIAVADVTGDGRGDLVAFKPELESGSGTIKVYPGSSGTPGAFGSAVNTSTSANSALFDGAGRFFLDAIDVTGDGLADLVTLADDGNVHVWPGAGSGAFGTPIASGGFSKVFAGLKSGKAAAEGREFLGLGDVGGDARADLAILNGEKVEVYAGAADGKFGVDAGGGLRSPTKTSLTGVIDSNLYDLKGEEALGLLDEDKDRRADLVTVRADGTLRIYRAQADASFKTTPVVHLLEDFTPLRTNFARGRELATEKPFLTRPGCYEVGCRWPSALTESDVDGDRYADLVTLKSDGTLYTFPGGGTHISGSWVASEGSMSPALYDGTGHYLIDTTDVTGDGRADLVTLTGAGWVRVHPGKSDKTFAEGITSSFQLPPVMNNAGTNEPIAVADMNGDRLGDLIAYTRVSGSGQLAFYPGRADGTFGGPSEGAKFSYSGLYSALLEGAGDYFLDAIDVTGDRLADVVAMDSEGSVKVYKGKLNGSFGAVITAASINPVLDDGTGQEPIGLGDVNRDGMADLLTLEASGPSYSGNLKLWVAKSDGSGTFLTPSGNAYSGSLNSTLMDGGTGEQFVGLLDYHGDRRADLVSAHIEGNGDIYSYPAQSDGATFGSRWTSGDITTARFKTSPGYEPATERPLIRRIGCTTSGCDWAPGAASVPSDVDGDRLSDLVTVDEDGTAHVYESDGSKFQTANGTASLPARLDPALFDGRGNYTVDVADVGGDGKSDLITLSADGDVFVHKGQSSGQFKGTASAAAEALEPMMNGRGDFEPIAVADVGGDGRADLVGYRGSATSGKVVSFAGAENGTFGVQTTAIASIDDALTDAKGQYFLDAIDVTGDGKSDLVTVDADSTLRIYKGQSGNTFATATASSVGVDPIMDNGEGHEPIGVADVTGDAKADLITLYSDGKLFVFAGKGDGTFELPAGGGKSGEPSYTGLDSSLLDGTGADFAGLIDYDGDERADLVALAPSGDVQAYRAAANSTFLAPVTSQGAIFSGRFDASPGHQPANELPFWRRGGCAAAGCDWPMASATARWTLSEIDPPPIARRQYEEVSCTSATACYAVGSKLEAGVEKSQIQFWDGTEWSVQSAPAPEGASASELSGVHCTSSTHCLAAGSYVESGGTRKTLILSWNGSAWSVISSPNVSGATSSELEGVSCSSSSTCIAAGSYRESDGVQKQLAMRLNAGSWTIGSSGLPSGASSAEYSDTTCAGSCLAVGSYVDSTTGVRKTRVVKTVFGIWSTESAANPSGATSARLLGVECPVSSPCTAVGRYIDSDGVRKTLAITRPATSGTWSVASTPNPTDSNAELNSVWCPTATECAAVGTYTDESGTHPLLEAWDATSGWMLGSMPAPESAASTRLSGIYCTSTNACAAVGNARYGNGQPRNLAYEYFDSNWTITQTDAPQPPAGAARAVACAPESDCVALLAMEDEEGSEEIARKLGSGGWTSMPALASVESPLLTDVSCTAASACTAVGTQGPAGERTTLAQRWNGTEWKSQTTPNPENASEIELNGVSCTSAEHCLATGNYTQSGTTKTLAMSWNGSSWAIQTTPNYSGATASLLEGVHCFSSSACAAVGSYFNSEGTKRIMALRWNGTEWALPLSMSLPSGATSSELNDVACPSSSSCFAVGSYLDAEGIRRRLSEKFAFGFWFLETLPSFGATATELTDVHCDSSSACAAVGVKAISGNEEPLTLKRSSSGTWTAQAASGPAGAAQASLDSVSCKATGNCVAVGSFDNGSFDEPLGLKGG